MEGAFQGLPSQVQDQVRYRDLEKGGFTVREFFEEEVRQIYPLVLAGKYPAQC